MVVPRLIDAGDGLLRLEAPGGAGLFTARAGGVSSGPFASLNLGPWTGDDPQAVAENQRRAALFASGDRRRELRIGRQVHAASVAVHRGGGADPALDGVDAHVTDRADLALAVLAADCVPVVVVGPSGVGVAHAGWRGLAAGVIEATVRELAAQPGAGDAAAIVAAIGPCAGPCCYESGEEVHAAFAGRPRGRAEGRHLDLPALARDALQRAGVTTVLDADRCTICDERYFSHRRSGGTTGRQAGIAWRA